MLRKLLSTLKLWPATEISQKTASETTKITSCKGITRKPRFKDLHEMYKPFDDVFVDSRMERLNETVELFEKFQRATMNYVLDINELAREYLVKARYREDKENFFNSLRVEPSRLMHSELWQYSKNY